MKYTTQGNCPFCDSERGIITSWGMSQEGWNELKKKHDVGHPENNESELQLIKPKTKKVKKYKYSRKDWLDYYEDLEHMHITKEAKEDLLAKESNEEYSQRIMMEQVPKKFSKKDYNKLNKALDNMAGHEPTGIFANKPVKGVLKEKHSTGKQEDNKDYRYVYCCPVHGEYYKVCPKCNPTPSPLDDICEIKRFILVTDGSDVVLYPEMKDMAIKLNEVIKTINLIIKQLKQK